MRLLFLLTSIAAFGGEFSTAIGDIYPYTIQAMTTDAAGNTYLTGRRTLSTGTDLFVTKLDPGGALMFTDTFAGNGTNTGYAIAVDPSGNIYVGGMTTAPDFPLTNALQTQMIASPAGFLIKLSGDGKTVIYSTYFGGTEGASEITSLAADAKGNLYVTGVTSSSDFPQNTGLPQVPLVGQGVDVMSGVMVAQISPTGNLIFSAVVASINNSSIQPLVGLDAAGNTYVTGYSANLPTTPGVITPSGNGAFIAKINPGAIGFGYLTYFGPSTSGINAMAVDAAGDVYVSGASQSATFPVTPGSLAPFYPESNVFPFIAKLNPSGSALIFGTVALSASSLSVDANGNVWGVGTNSASSFPNTNGWTSGPEYLVGLSATGSSLIYSALFPQGTIAQAVSVDGAGLVHVAGEYGFVSAINPNAPPSMKVFTLENGFLSNPTARVSPAEVIAIYGPGIGPSTAATASPANNRYPTTLGGVSVQVNGTSVPLLYVSATQINAVLPMELAANTGATIQVTNAGVTSPAFPLRIVSSEGMASSTVFNADWSVNSSTNPAHAGSYVTIYATGAQWNFAPLTDGQIATAANDICQGGCSASMEAITVPICIACFAKPAAQLSESPISATVLYGGAAPGMVAGISQFNVQVGTAGQTFTVPLGFQLKLISYGATIATSGISVVP